ncbi:BTB/POZ domain-containing protein At3g22104, partial [Linum grandiflorum]
MDARRRRRHLLQVDVAGEEIFLVDKQILESYSGRLNRLFRKTKPTQLITKLIFDGFPGGADGFELITRFCYTGGKLQITPSNFILLHSAAQFMEIDTNQSFQTEEAISSWSWFELVSALNQCQDLAISSCSSRSSSFMLRKVLECTIARISIPVIASSSTISFSDRSGDDISSSSSITTTSARRRWWWFEDLVFLNPDLMDKLARLMVEKKLDHSVIFKFLIFYLKFNIRGGRFLGSNFEAGVTEAVVNLFTLLDRNALSCCGLFDVLRIVSRLGAEKMKVKLETLIGLVLDGANLDQLMVVPSGKRKHCYDVGLVMRLVKAFLIEGWVSPVRLRRVVSLIDSYVREVAPDSLLNPSEFEELVTILPDWGRECSDVLYQAIDIYLEIHANELCGSEEKVRICKALNRTKLSTEAARHFAGNQKFRPSSSTTAVKVFARRGKSKNVTFYGDRATTLNVMSHKDRSLPKLC